MRGIFLDTEGKRGWLSLLLILLLAVAGVHCEEEGTSGGNGFNPDGSVVNSHFVGQLSLRYRYDPPFIDASTCLHVDLYNDGRVEMTTDAECTGVITYDVTEEGDNTKHAKSGTITLTGEEGYLWRPEDNEWSDDTLVAIVKSGTVEELYLRWIRLDPAEPWREEPDYNLPASYTWSDYLYFDFFRATSEEGDTIALPSP